MYSLTMNFLRSLNIKRGQKGQALVEMALSITLLVLLVFGITEFGRAMYTKNTLTNAARAGARVGVVTARLPVVSTPQQLGTSGYTCTNANPQNCVYQAISNGLFFGINPDNVYVSIGVAKTPPNLDSTKAEPNDIVTVNVELRNFTSFVPRLISITNTLTGDASMRQEQ